MVNRNDLPRVVNAAIDAIADAPMSAIGRIAARRLGRPAPRGSVAATRFDDRPRRVLIAPVNYSGQGTAWARALERADPDLSARNMAIDVPGGFSFDADLVVPVGSYHNDADWQERQFEAASRATHVLIEAEEPPFGRLLGRSVGAQARALMNRGVNVAYLAHGTDVRLPSRHMAANSSSYYADPSIYVPRAEALAARNIALVEDSGRPAFVSTPDLLLDLPGATWCPVVVDLRRWAVDRVPRAQGTPLRVAHAPSVAAAKGTALIMPALERLEAEGVIRLDLISGVPSAEMPPAFAAADVVLDQFRAGSYGVAACEAMAAGCIVVGSVSQQVREEVRAQTGLEVPILEASPDTLERMLRDLAADPDLDARRADMTEFVGDVHDGRRSARALLEHWIAPATPHDRKDRSRATRS
ncbi:hypothetical protein [Agromyces subbeticus]|uniref:hypothetical protein n=1 Tax=Agromyces subbeticus TaxID=293890 RepID=UPI0003B4758D|nr:hypothetical protein [Agromyces subbeticus]